MERAFIEKTDKPTEESLKEVLGVYYEYYIKLLNEASGFDTKWSFYKGWSQKVFDKKKALFYFIPLHDAFKISLTIRENEKEQLLSLDNILFIHEQIENSTKYNEGYDLQLMVEDNNSFEKCKAFILEIIKLR